MTTFHSFLRFLRRLHLYIGVFIAPALLFFAFTGALQTFGLHETSPGSSYKPPAWIATLAQIHKKQTDIIPVRKPRPESAQPAVPSPARPYHSDAPPKTRSHLPLKLFFLCVSLGLFTSTLTGIYMSYKYARSKWLITALLLAGIGLPLVLLPF